MKSHFLTPSKTHAALILAILGVLQVGVRQTEAELVIGLTNTNSLVTFDSASPAILSAPVLITGMGSEIMFDIDIRPADQLLYGLSSAGKLYSINPTTGLATLSATIMGVSLDATATRFGIDFNPTVDRLRIVSNTGQNLRLTPGTRVTSIDGNLNGAASGAVSVAYTNNDIDPTTGTTLFYINSGNPGNTYNTSNPNGGVLSLVGSLGVATTQDAGFDISGTSGIAYASLTNPTGVGSSLYRINLTTGAATLIGMIGGGPAGGPTVRGIAAPTAAPDAGTTALLLGFGLAALFLTQLALPRRQAAPN